MNIEARPIGGRERFKLNLELLYELYKIKREIGNQKIDTTDAIISINPIVQYRFSSEKTKSFFVLGGMGFLLSQKEGPGTIGFTAGVGYNFKRFSITTRYFSNLKRYNTVYITGRYNLFT